MPAAWPIVASVARAVIASMLRAIASAATPSGVLNVKPSSVMLSRRILRGKRAASIYRQSAMTRRNAFWWSGWRSGAAHSGDIVVSADEA